MKKQIVRASSAFLALSLIVLSACKKDSSDNNSIVGSWELTKTHELITTTTPPQTLDTTYSYTHGQSFMVVFNSNGHYLSVDYTSTTPDTASFGTYTYSNNQVITKADGSSASDTANVIVSGNTMTVTTSEISSASSYTTTETFTRQ